MPIYMKFEGIPNPRTTGRYAGWIELESCQLGVSRNATGTTARGVNREASVPSVSEIVVTKHQDDASAGLFQASLWGESKKVTIDFVKGDGDPYMSIEMEGVLISSYSISGHGGAEHSRPMEALSLNFLKISFNTKPTAPPSTPKHAMNMTEWKLAIANMA